MAMIDLEQAAGVAYDLGHQWACIVEKHPMPGFVRQAAAVKVAKIFYQFLTTDEPHSLDVRKSALQVQIREFDTVTNNYFQHSWLNLELKKKEFFNDNVVSNNNMKKEEITQIFENVEKLYTGAKLKKFASQSEVFKKLMLNMQDPKNIVSEARRRLKEIEDLTLPTISKERVIGKRSV